MLFAVSARHDAIWFQYCGRIDGRGYLLHAISSVMVDECEKLYNLCIYASITGVDYPYNLVWFDDLSPTKICVGMSIERLRWVAEAICLRAKEL